MTAFEKNKREIVMAMVLALAGGFMDSYSYLNRGKVFANAQTGNILLFGVNLSLGEFSMALKYFWPILSFSIGIFVSASLRYRVGKNGILHWQRGALFIEAFLFIIIAFIPHSLDSLANSMTSLCCAIQVESFRNIDDKSIATTMCIGNLKNAMENLYLYLETKDEDVFNRFLLYISLIIFFALGAIFGSFSIEILKMRSTILCSLILIIASVFVER